MKAIKDFWYSLSFLKKVVVGAILAFVVVFVLIQLVPYGRNHSNPPVVSEPDWDSPQTREFAVRACFDCHSNEVRWPWYSNIAPASWIVQRGVDRGRGDFSFSEWDAPQEVSPDPEAWGEFFAIVRVRAMPLCDYIWLHPSARLSAEEVQAFAQGLEATVGVPVTDLAVREKGKSFFNCARQDFVSQVVPAPIRSKRLILAFVVGFLLGGATVAAGYRIYRARKAALL